MLNLTEFPERLKELMIERNINAPTLAKIIETDRTNITRYLRGDRLPTYNVFVRMLEYFQCSADFLIGGEFAEVTRPPLVFSERLRSILKEYGISQYALVKNANMSWNILHKWLTGQNYPSLENLVKLASFIDCSVDYLLGRVS